MRLFHYNSLDSLSLFNLSVVLIGCRRCSWVVLATHGRRTSRKVTQWCGSCPFCGFALKSCCMYFPLFFFFHFLRNTELATSVCWVEGRHRFSLYSLRCIGWARYTWRSYSPFSVLCGGGRPRFNRLADWRKRWCTRWSHFTHPIHTHQKKKRSKFWCVSPTAL